MSSSFTRGFTVEINKMINTKIVVQTNDGKTYTGILKGMTDNLAVVLNDVKTGGKSYYKLVIAGSLINYITLGDTPFDIMGLVEELIKVFKPENVRFLDDSNTILVMDRIRVTEDEVQGEGVVADRIRSIWNAYKKKKQ